MKKSVIILKMLWPTIAIQEIVFHQMAKVSEPLILNNLKVTNKDISFLVTQYTMKKPNEMFISRVRAQALKNIYGDPNEEVQKLPTLESFFNDLGHSCKVLFKEPAHMLNTLEEASKFARKYELKEGIPKSFLDMLWNDDSKNNDDSIQVQDKRITPNEEILLETVGEKSLVDLMSPLS